MKLRRRRHITEEQLNRILSYLPTRDYVTLDDAATALGFVLYELGRSIDGAADEACRLIPHAHPTIVGMRLGSLIDRETGRAKA